MTQDTIGDINIWTSSNKNPAMINAVITYVAMKYLNTSRIINKTCSAICVQIRIFYQIIKWVFKMNAYWIMAKSTTLYDIGIRWFYVNSLTIIMNSTVIYLVIIAFIYVYSSFSSIKLFSESNFIPALSVYSPEFLIVKL